MQNATLLRRVPTLPTSSPNADRFRGWTFPARALANAVQLPPERLIRAVLANMDSWVDALDTIYEDAVPVNRSRVLHLKRNMLQCKISMIRLVGGTQEEIDAAHAQANRHVEWPET